jgi:hypothetical protein
MPQIVLAYTPQPRQQLLHATTARQIFYGGAAGGGKTKSLRWDAIAFALRNPGFVGAIFRRTMPQLRQNHIEQIKQELPQEVGSFSETRNTFEFSNGSRLIFKHLERDADCEDIQGWELHWAGVDEASQCTAYMLGYIKTRLRLGEWKPQDPEDAKRLPRLVLASNPGGQSHNYLKQLFIETAPPETIFHDPSTRDPEDPNDKGWTSIYIPARMADNRFIESSYRAQFSNIPEWQAKQLRDGDWDVVPGAFFECWGPKNILRPFKVPDYWPRFRSLDWGFATPFSIAEWAISDGEEIPGGVWDAAGNHRDSLPADAIVRVWEWYGGKNGYGRGNVGVRTPAEAVAAQVMQMRPDVKVAYTVADESMWRTDSGPSAAEKFRKKGMPLRPAERERIPGWQEMYGRIDEGLLFATTDCEAFIRCIPSIQADPAKPEDVLKEGEDHPADEARYACMSRPRKKSKPIEVDHSVKVKPITFHDIMNQRRTDRRMRI